ncbi:N-acetylmuramoyl-L-alanine amidase [Sulfurimonas sp. MAG313]|nr:N-acetylmuramoyl-L-alanine amidase [Sulfurimonas sp. MAG313]MDF1880931.1 N-acetylmuramoyl-L-alanine amidase [Sulfurimonas sp. MAG313]
MRYILGILLFSIFLCADVNTQALKRADKSSNSSQKSEIIRAYNDYRNIYIRALMKDDDILCKTCLRGLIKTGKKLHIDVINYENKLKKLSHKKSKKLIEKKKRPDSVKHSISGKNRLRSIRWKDSQRLVLRFSRDIKKSEVNRFSLNYSKQKKFKTIYDIYAVLTEKTMSLQHTSVKKIRLAQFDQKTLRIVFESDTKIIQQYKISGHELTIKMSSENKELRYIPLHANTSNKIIVIDPGHGGKDAGAVGYKKYREKIVVLQTAKKLRDILLKRGYTVYMTRNSDDFVKLRKRTKFANKKKADLFLSIHANSVPKRNRKKAKGIETYFLSTKRSKRAESSLKAENSDISKLEKSAMNTTLHLMSREKIFASNKLAIDLQQNMLATLKTHYKVKDGGVRSGPFWVLVGAEMPAVLIELGFISHPDEAKLMVNHRYQKKQAIGIANGVDRYFAKNL